MSESDDNPGVNEPHEDIGNSEPGSSDDTVARDEPVVSEAFEAEPKAPNQANHPTSREPKIPTRRAFLYGALGGGASLAVGAAAGFDIADYKNPQTEPESTGQSSNEPSLGAQPDPDTRAGQAYYLITSAARGHYDDAVALPEQPSNGDQERYASERHYATFTKPLPCNDFGEVDPEAFEAFRRALRTGKSSDFDEIPLDSAATRTLANPQAAFKFVLNGSDGHTTRIKPAHTFRSPQLAAEMAEVYWQALLRDVPFSAYAESELVEAALTDLNAMTVRPGLSDGGTLERQRLFRGETPGDLRGPYVSQFLLQNFSFGPVDVTQRYASPAIGVDYMTDRDSWLAVQRGVAPSAPLAVSTEKKYIFNNRVLGEFVHSDVTGQAYIHAALILLQRGPNVLDPNNPYASSVRNQAGFVSFGTASIIDLVMRAANLSLTGAWFQKWRAHLTLRPEVYAARVQFNLNGDRSYEINDDILNSDVVARLQTQNGNGFLPVAYPEGSPTHPSYPAGHACIAGACVTILKAMFNESAKFTDPVNTTNSGDELLLYPNELTVGDELNKLAANISFARNAAGVHYRQDGIEGIAGGEQQAIALLQDESRTTIEAGFKGFNLTKFDGTPITIRDGKVST